MARTSSSGRWPGRGRRRWVTVDGSPSTNDRVPLTDVTPAQARRAAPRPAGPPPEQPPRSSRPFDREPTIRRRYPWHDDPDYDPAEYRRVQPATPGGTPSDDHPTDR